MPPKIKVPDGEMTSTELRKLIRAHNILVSIKIPKGTDRDGLIALIQSKGYKVDHKKKAIIDSKADRPRRPQVTLEKANILTKPKPVSEEEKKKRQQARQKKKGEKAFLKVAIPKAPPVSKKPSKVIKVGKPPPKKTPVPKGSHRMPDGSIMKDSDMKKKTPVKKTPAKKSDAYVEGYGEGVDQAEDDVDSGNFEDAEVLDPTAPIVTDYKTKSEQKDVITGWKDGYLDIMKKNDNPHLDTTPKVKTPVKKTPPKKKPAKKQSTGKNQITKKDGKKLLKITKKVSLNDFLKNLTKINAAPEFIKIRDTMTDDEIIKRFNNTDDWKRFDVPIQKRLGKLLGFKL